MITVDAVLKSLEKMRKVYPFKNEDTVFRMDRDICSCGESVVCIATVDEETGVKVRMEMDAEKEMLKGENHVR